MTTFFSRTTFQKTVRTIADQERAFLTIVRNQTTPEIIGGEHGPFFGELVKRLTPENVKEFLWVAFEFWYKRISNVGGEGMLFALSLWGDDFLVQELFSRIQGRGFNHPIELKITAIDVLRTIGTPTAISFIKGYANSSEHRKIIQKASSVYDSIARERGVPPHELDIQNIPDCGIDQNGVRAFDFGPRRILVTVGFDFKPCISNEFGKTKPRFPAPVRKDNPSLAARAQREWRLVREQFRLIREFYLPIFEKTMLRRQTWDAGSFLRYLVSHPVVGNYCRRLVWGAFDDQGGLLRAFRICEDNTFSTCDDIGFALPLNTRIGVIHPAQLSEAEHQRWIENFSEYFIIQPFPQLNRIVLRLSKEEMEGVRINRFKDFEMDSTVFEGELKKTSWEISSYSVYQKYFPWLNITAIADYTPAGSPKTSNPGPKRKIRFCYFLQGKREKRSPPWDCAKLPLGKIDPIAISEVLTDLTQILNVNQ